MKALAIVTLTIQIIIPGIESVYNLFDQGKIGKSELNLLEKIISNSLQIINLESVESDPKKKIIVTNRLILL